jgi:26S proteasome non-ATPase regulatory subunit 10
MSSNKPLIAASSQDLFSTEDTIQQAAYSGNLALVELLRKKGSKISDKDLDGRTALHWAACGGHSHLLQHFFSVDEDGAKSILNDKDDAGWAPLHSAVSSGHCEVAAILLEQGADPNVTTKNGRTSLHYLKGNSKMAQLLVEHYSVEAINARDEVGSTALCRAATLGHLDVTSILLKAGASINLANASGNSPLHLACYEGRKDVATLLLKSGASEDVTNKAGKKPVELASGDFRSSLLEA